MDRLHQRIAYLGCSIPKYLFSFVPAYSLNS
jgi:hypothetical protein